MHFVKVTILEDLPIIINLAQVTSISRWGEGEEDEGKTRIDFTDGESLTVQEEPHSILLLAREHN